MTYPERFYVIFTSSFRSDSTPCVSHETVDKQRTLCGRKVSDAATFEPDSNNPPVAAPTVVEAQLKCETCFPGHRLGSLQSGCGVSGCECWCNR